MNKQNRLRSPVCKGRIPSCPATDEAPENFFDISFRPLAGGKHTFSMAEKNGEQFATELDVLAALIRARVIARVLRVKRQNNVAILDQRARTRRVAAQRRMVLAFPLCSRSTTPKRLPMSDERSLRNSISYITLNVPQTMVAILFELTIFMAAAAWATEPGASHLRSSHLRYCWGIYRPRFRPPLSRLARPPVHSRCRNRVAVRCIRRLVHLRQTHRNRDLELDVGGRQFCSRRPVMCP